MKSDSIKTEECYIVYFDILGYEQYFEENKDSEQLLQDIVHMIKDIKKRVDVFKNLGFQDIHIKAFSDNVIICIKCKDLVMQELNQLGFLIANIEWLILLKYNLLVRGAFTKGKIYMDSNIVYGEGLIRAVQLESEAKFPRIIIDKMFKKDDFEFLGEDIASEDIDGQLFIDYFLKMKLVFESYPIIKENIIKQIKRYGKYNKQLKDENKIRAYDAIIQKILWLVEKHNQACDIINLPKEKINYLVSVNSVLLKMEIHLDE